jgi:hypothetical protein
MPDGLVAFLNARYDETEKVAEAAIGNDSPRWTADGGEVDHDGEDWKGPIVYDEGKPTDAQAQHIALHDPASVLLDLEAKRAVLAVHRPRSEALQDSSCYAPEACDGCGSDDYGPFSEHTDDCPTLRALALQFRPHPEYRAEWVPQT